MTVQQLESLNACDSDDMVSLGSNDDLYRRKFQLLLERCEVLQQDNERIVNRIHEVKKVSRRFRKDIKLLVQRLDAHRDGFRRAATEVEIKIEPQVQADISNAVPAHKVVQSAAKPVDKSTPTLKKPALKRKIKAEKVEKDPNAPKKPCNAFFQFCQEQRPLVMSETTADSGTEPSKQEVTRQLASRWRALPLENKKVYVAMFERSKLKYAEEMTAYNIKKEQ